MSGRSDDERVGALTLIEVVVLRQGHRATACRRNPACWSHQRNGEENRGHPWATLGNCSYYTL